MEIRSRSTGWKGAWGTFAAVMSDHVAIVEDDVDPEFPRARAIGAITKKG